ncbi:unnamed protein product [Effrenium voratum]|nr:unnamed protein product [Effrenium voratum]
MRGRPLLWLAVAYLVLAFLGQSVQNFAIPLERPGHPVHLARAAQGRQTLVARLAQRVAYVAVVDVNVKSDQEQQFLEASLQNARSSKGEPLNQRFDVLQLREDPSRFALVEIYRNADGPAGHKETAHYAAWRDTVADMMETPRSASQWDTIFPGKASDYHPKTIILERPQGAGDVDITHVFVSVKAGAEEAFKKATRANAMESVKEYGNLRFDLLQNVDSPTEFLLIEVYKTAGDAAKHKDTKHYKEWRTTVEDMAKPREGRKYVTHFPSVPAAWKVSEQVY